jgi:WD40 repeat protein
MHFVMTGCSDEQIRIWDLSQLDDSEGAGLAYSGKLAKKSLVTNAANALEAYKDGKVPPGLVYELEGHFHEVCKLMLWSAKEERDVDGFSQGRSSSSASDRGEVYIVSAGLDCTVRKWKLKDMLELARIGGAGRDKDERTECENKTLEDIRNGREEQPKTSAMTAEEEAELAELMDED